MVGPEGRGVPTIIEMVAMTRFDCMIGSSAGMRMAVSQAIDHCRQRKAFGAFLIDQPMMTAVLADLAIEAEAALTLTMRIARALDHRDDAHEDALVRLGSAIGKYWICKRTPGHAYEALECLGGSGVMEDSPMPRLYREAPVNAIWEAAATSSASTSPGRSSARRRRLRPISPRSPREGRKRRARRACLGAQGRPARPRDFESRGAICATGSPSGLQAAAFCAPGLRSRRPSAARASRREARIIMARSQGSIQKRS